MQVDEGDLREEAAAHLPPCLAERAGLTGSVFCHVCGVVLASAAEAVGHNAEKHSGTTCSYCGLVLPSVVAVAIHQMVVDVSARWGYGFQMAVAKFLDCRHLALRA